MDRRRFPGRREREIKLTTEFLAAVLKQVSENFSRDLLKFLSLESDPKLEEFNEEIEKIVDKVLKNVKAINASLAATKANLVATNASLVATSVDLRDIINLLDASIGFSAKNRQQIKDTISIGSLRASNFLAAINYAVLTKNSFIRLSRTLCKLNLQDPGVILLFSVEIGRLLSHIYGVLTHVDELYSPKPVFSRAQLYWDTFIFITALCLDDSYRNFFMGGRRVVADHVLQRVAANGLPDHIQFLFRVPFCALKKKFGRLRFPSLHNLIIREPLSVLPKVALVKKKYRVFFSRVKSINFQKLNSLPSQNLKENFSFIMNKKNEFNHIAIFAVENYKPSLPILKADFLHFMVNNYNSLRVDVPVARVAPAIKDVIVQKTTSYKLRLVSPVSKFKIFKTFLHPFKGL